MSASSNMDKSFFFLVPFFEAAPNLDLTALPEPIAASSAARSSAFSRFLRAASSALAAFVDHEKETQSGACSY